MATYTTSNLMFTLPNMNAQCFTAWVVDSMHLINVENIAIGYTVDGYDNVNAQTVTVTITETQDVINIFVDRAGEWFASTDSGLGIPHLNS